MFPIKRLCTILKAPWYVQNTFIQSDFQTSTVTEEIAATSPYTVLASAQTQTT
jgi:hypothetical protein